MISEQLSQTDLLVFPLFAVVLFSSIFVGMLMWVFRPGARAGYEARGRMILDGNDTTETRNASEGPHVQP